ncbi:MAG: WbqC family protein [Bacteroides sp.]|nr:WbqC family protein [Bacteroides sp.]MCM1095399.1 WbqC family protein [Terasakiella sp.]
MSACPLPLHPEAAVCLPPRLFGPVEHYAAMAACGRVAIDYDGRWDKRDKATHRYDIADTRGRLSLTVPVSVPHGCGDGPMTRSRVRLSRHGEWWRVHRIALESAYGRTPYFEFVIDRFLPLLADPGDEPLSLGEYLRRADRAILDFLGLPVERVDAAPDAAPPRAVMPVVYSQVRGERLGFIPGLSILDAIFNLGPETPLLLHRMIR